jgi:hypothetical protein
MDEGRLATEAHHAGPRARIRQMAVETHENWLRYLNMDDLREHKKEALRRVA